ncbi:MAG: PaaI family thioesterase [Pseudomonadota bacterium]
MTRDDAAAFLNTAFAPWVLALGPEVTGFGVEGAALTIPITPDIARAGGIVSGQTMATLADTAMVLACVGHLGKIEPISTVTLDTQFLRPGAGDTLIAEAEVTRAGRAMIFARCSLRTEPSDKTVALATATFARTT